MSANEVIEQIKALTPADRKAVTEFIKGLAPDEGTTAAKSSDDPQFDAALDVVFEKHGQLLHRLAQ